MGTIIDDFPSAWWASTGHPRRGDRRTKIRYALGIGDIASLRGRRTVVGHNLRVLCTLELLFKRRLGQLDCTVGICSSAYNITLLTVHRTCTQCREVDVRPTIRDLIVNDDSTRSPEIIG
jgi:hypothetical protein